MSRPGLALHVRRLEDLLREAGSRPRVLDRILQRCTFSPAPDGVGLATVLGLEWPGEAALTRRVDAPGDFHGCWLRADPVCLVADINRVWVAPGAPASLDPALRSRLADRLGAVFAEAGLSFDWPVAGRGYVRCPELPASRFAPLTSIGGRGLDEVLPDGPDQALWRRLLNESQMIFHELAGPADAPGPNTLWFWGPGQDLRPPPCHGFAGHFGGSPLILGLADWLSLPGLAGLDELAGPALGAWEPDMEKSAEANLEDLCATWLEPAWSRLTVRRLSRLTLVSASGVAELGTRQAWYFWRRRSALPGTGRA